MPVPDLEIDPCRCNRVFCCEYSWASVSHILHLVATTGIIHPGIMNDSPLLYWCTLRTCWVMTRLSVHLIPLTNACPRFRRRPCQLNESFFPKVLSPCELCIVTFFFTLLMCIPDAPSCTRDLSQFLVDDLGPPSTRGSRCSDGWSSKSRPAPAYNFGFWEASRVAFFLLA